MEHLENIAQNYLQAPWRKQKQLAGIFLLVIVSIVIIAGLYLSVSTRTAQTGREIQSMQKIMLRLERENEDIRSKLANIYSSNEMQKRASSLGFNPVQPDQIEYLAIPGYVERSPIILAPYVHREATGVKVTPPQYTESLLDWLRRQIERFTYSRNVSP
jgi:cell division protein FtsL